MEKTEELKLLIIEELERLDFDALSLVKIYVNALFDYSILKVSER